MYTVPHTEVKTKGKWVTYFGLRVRQPSPVCSPFCARCADRWDNWIEWVQFLSWLQSSEAPTKDASYTYKKFVRASFDISTEQ